MFNRVTFHALAMCLLIACVTTPAWPQSASSSVISGTVTDTSGGLLPGVTVEIASPALIEQTRTTVTDGDGRYRVVNLRPGAYEVTFSLSGFSTVRREGIDLPPAFTAKIDAKMTVGAIEETVTVTTAAPIVDVQGTLEQTVLNRESLDTLPTGRNIYGQASMASGVTTDRPDVGGAQGAQAVRMTVHGSDTVDMKYTIDGMSVNSNNNHGETTGLYYNDAMMEEVTFQSSALPAEAGAGGIRFNIILKAGGNTFHGSAFGSAATHSMQSSNLSEDLRRRGMRAPDAVDRIYDLNASIGGPIKRDRVWFFTSARFWGVDSLVADTFNLDGSQAIDDNRLSDVLGRLTWQIDRKNKLSMFYDNQGKYRGHRRPGGTAFITPEATWLQRSPRAYMAQAKWVSTATNKLLLESGLSIYYLNWTQEYRPEAQGTIGRVDFIRSIRSGAAPYYHSQWAPRYTYTGSVSYVTGSHNVKTGIQFSHAPYRQQRQINGDMILRFRNGVPDSIDAFTTPVDVHQNLVADMGVYAQDSWKLDKATINAGVRLEHYSASIDEQVAPASTFVGERRFQAISGVPAWTTVVPRLGVAYDWAGDGKTAIKASVSQYMRSEGMSLTATLNPMSVGRDRRSWVDRNGDELAQLDELGPSTGFQGGPNVTFDPDLKRPNNWEYVVSVSHEVLPQFSVTASYFHRDYKDLYGVKNTLVTPEDYTPVALTNPLTNEALTVYNQEPATRGHVNLVLSNYDELDRHYNGFDLKLDKRFSNGASLFGVFTAGRNEGSVRGEDDDLNNPNILINHVGAVGYDSTYQFKMAGDYPLPFGVSISAVFRAQTGLPLRRVLNVTRSLVPNLTQVSQEVDLVEPGESRFASRRLLDLRARKEFTLRGLRLRVLVDLYNVLNSSATLSEVQSVGPRLGSPSKVVPGRLLRLGFQLEF